MVAGLAAASAAARSLRLPWGKVWLFHWLGGSRMRPKSLVWMVSASVMVVLVGLLLAAGGGVAREGQAAGDPVYDYYESGDPSAVTYVDGEMYGRDGQPMGLSPTASAVRSRPSSAAGVVCGLGMLGVFVFLGILALRGTADNVVRIRDGIE